MYREMGTKFWKRMTAVQKVIKPSKAGGASDVSKFEVFLGCIGLPGDHALNDTGDQAHEKENYEVVNDVPIQLSGRS